jgi:hypothetical protein
LGKGNRLRHLDTMPAATSIFQSVFHSLNAVSSSEPATSELNIAIDCHETREKNAHCGYNMILPLVLRIVVTAYRQEYRLDYAPSSVSIEKNSLAMYQRLCHSMIYSAQRLDVHRHKFTQAFTRSGWLSRVNSSLSAVNRNPLLGAYLFALGGRAEYLHPHFRTMTCAGAHAHHQRKQAIVQEASRSGRLSAQLAPMQTNRYDEMVQDAAHPAHKFRQRCAHPRHTYSSTEPSTRGPIITSIMTNMCVLHILHNL